MRFCHGGFAQLSVTIRKSKRINELPPYLFAEIDRRKREALSRGVDLIDLGIGDPDIPTPSVIVEKLMESASKPVNHRYPNSSGMAEFREAVAQWYKARFNVNLDPTKEVVSLIGSKEGIGNMAVAFVDPGDVVLVASPCYPVYHIGTAFSGGKNYFLPLKGKTPFCLTWRRSLLRSPGKPNSFGSTIPTIPLPQWLTKASLSKSSNLQTNIT